MLLSSGVLEYSNWYSWAMFLEKSWILILGGVVLIRKWMLRWVAACSCSMHTVFKFIFKQSSPSLIPLIAFAYWLLDWLNNTDCDWRSGNDWQHELYLIPSSSSSDTPWSFYLLFLFLRNCVTRHSRKTSHEQHQAFNFRRNFPAEHPRIFL